MGAQPDLAGPEAARHLSSRSFLSQLIEYAGKGKAVSAAMLHAAA